MLPFAPYANKYIHSLFVVSKLIIILGAFVTDFIFLQEGHAYMKRRANRSANNAPLNHVKDSLPVFFEVHETLTGESL